jgi:hypothetical protein
VTWSVKLLILVAALIAGFAAGNRYQRGVQAQREIAARDLANSDRLQQRKFADRAAGQQAATVAAISTQLGDAREKIAQLSGRQCLDAGTVGMLNNIGAEPSRAAAGEPADQAPAAATGGGFRFATERDTAVAIATCRAYYGEVSGQLNQILDIEDRRWPTSR